MKKKQFKVTYASSVTQRVSARTGNNYSLQDVVLVATDEPIANDDGSPSYPTSIAVAIVNEQPLKIGDTISCDVRLTVGRAASGKYFTRVDISNVNVDKTF